MQSGFLKVLFLASLTYSTVNTPCAIDLSETDFEVVSNADSFICKKNCILKQLAQIPDQNFRFLK